MSADARARERARTLGRTARRALADVVELDFYSATVLYSNLGGVGPDIKTPGIRYREARP